MKEPLVRDGSAFHPPTDILVADLSVRGAWQPQVTALFDVRIVDTDAPSYLGKFPEAVLKDAEREKKNKFPKACEERHASFTPSVCQLMVLLGLKCGPDTSTKWDRSYASTLYWV